MNKIEEALRSAEKFIELGIGFHGDVLAELKSALSEIEKCEPVAMMRVNEFGEYGLYLKSDYKHLPIGEHDLFTSPISKEWDK